MGGFCAGGFFFFNYFVAPFLLFFTGGGGWRLFFPAVPAWGWLVGFISLNGIVNLLGIEFTARVNRYMLVMELVTLGLFVVLGLIALYGGAGARGLPFNPFFEPRGFSWPNASLPTPH